MVIYLDGRNCLPELRRLDFEYNGAALVQAVQLLVEGGHDVGDQVSPLLTYGRSSRLYYTWLQTGSQTIIAV